jgi:UDP-glucose 4-epimerase
VKVLLTGGAGFIGSHIAELLAKQGIPTVIVDNFSRGRVEYLDSIKDQLTIYKEDISSSGLLDIFLRERPTHVIHQAAQISVQYSMEKPLADARTNILGTLNLLECCRKFKVEKIVHASSAAVYGQQSGVLDEMATTQPQSGYGISKLASENYIQLYRDTYGLDYVILRYANVYGPRQNTGGDGSVTALFIDSLLRGKNPVIYGDGEQTRDFIFVEDIARANYLALFSPGSEILNISTNSSTTINRLLQELTEIIGADLKPTFAPNRPGDVKHSQLDNRKARAYLGWEPLFSLRKGLTETCAYFVKMQHHKKRTGVQTGRGELNG